MFNNIYNIYFLLTIIFTVSCDNEIKVDINQGALSGLVEKTFLYEKPYYSFRGIPYAEPPLGHLRFKPPTPKAKWEGLLKAHNNKPTCFQLSSRRRNNEPSGFSGSEDCLYLNVYTPHLDGSFPVIVFDYNDNFKTGFNGSDTYSPDFFIEENVIVVTINHRLNIFGYLTTEDDAIPANAGLKDFILGLRWIKDNIRAFGGDPTRVTLMGSRGGAAIANILLYSKKANGLFSAVIMQSGSAMESVYFDRNSREKAFKLGEALNITTEDSNVLLSKLQDVEPAALLAQEPNIIDENEMDTYQLSVHPFSPTVERESSDAVITKLPEESDIVNDVPVLIGFNSREGLDLVSPFLMEPRLIDNVRDFMFVFPVRVDYRFQKNSTVYKKALQEIQSFYMKDGHLHYENILEYSTYVADVLQNYALHSAAKQLVENLNSNVYYYLFAFRGLFNENTESITKYLRFSIENWGATVTDELCYLHLCSRLKKTYQDLKKLPSEQVEFKVLKKLVRLWTNFAKTGNPTPTDDDELLKKIKWLPMDRNNPGRNYLHITKRPRMNEENPLSKRSEFWDQFLNKYRELSVNGVVPNEIIHSEL